ncbi:hypothetical protein [Solicola gregarius]|uniref:Polyketide cyclase / dehydrase and lipid transport n=1 Tax=Solicola gregarius TaxID=2908642 RepID=A0AA46TIE4_9ACTN|nr:hypothetical protein [Solicola gregarius]UYM05402.1 hypothetical protein L0C25_23310 [Solicola gregarius]
MPMLDVTDETLVVATPEQVREVLCEESFWEDRLPGVRLRCIDDRDELGKRWSVHGAMRGSAEVWLEPWLDAVVVHVFWQVDLADGHRPSARVRRRYAVDLKAHVAAVKDRLEAGRAPGTPRAGQAGE